MKVKFVPQNVEFEIKPGESVMHLAEDNGIYVKSVCRGVPSCAECRVKVVEGETNMFQPVAAELALIGSGWFIDRRRLSCQLQCIGDVTVDMSEQIAKQQGLIGGRKAKAAKALGDRVEDETVIRVSTEGGGRSRDRDEDEGESPAAAPRENRSRDQRPPPPKNNVVIGGPKSGAAAPVSASHEARAQEPRPQSPRPQAGPSAGGGGGIQPRREGDAPPAQGEGPGGPQGGGQGGGGGRSGRSRRGGRGRR